MVRIRRLFMWSYKNCRSESRKGGIEDIERREIEEEQLQQQRCPSHNLDICIDQNPHNLHFAHSPQGHKKAKGERHYESQEEYFKGNNRP